MSDVHAILEKLELAALAEMAERLLPPIVRIDDPKAAAARTAELAGLLPESTGDLETLAEQTGQGSLTELAGVMRALIADVVASEPGREAEVLGLADELGRKQIVVGPELYAIGALLLAAYVAYRSGGKKKIDREIEITEADDGRTRVKIRERIEYLNPFGPLSNLLTKVFGSPGSANDA
jgi:hypothetical protein